MVTNSNLSLAWLRHGSNLDEQVELGSNSEGSGISKLGWSQALEEVEFKQDCFAGCVQTILDATPPTIDLTLEQIVNFMTGSTRLSPLGLAAL